MAVSAKESQVYAVIGSDETEVKRSAAALAEKLTPPGADAFSLEVIDGMVMTVDDAVARLRAADEALRTYGFFGTGKFVWLKGCNFFDDSRTGSSEAVVSACERLVATLESGLDAGTRFLLSAGKVDKRRSFYKTLTRIAKVSVHDLVDASQDGWQEVVLERIVTPECRAQGLVFREDALDVFVNRTGPDRRAILNNVEKLTVYRGGSKEPVTVEDVETMVPVSREAGIFELGNHIAAKDLNRAAAQLDLLFDQETTPVTVMLVAIIPTVRNLLLAKDLMERHRIPRPSRPFSFSDKLKSLPASAIAHLPRKKDGEINTYALGIAACQAGKHTASRLAAMLADCLNTNVAMVTSSDNPEDLTRQLVVRLCS